MAEKPPRPPLVKPARETGKESKQAFDFDARRRIADQQKILTADDLGGMYSIGRQLFTTIDGVARPLTIEDLKRFRAARDAIVKSRVGKFKQIPRGITPKEIINLSWPDDRERANKQIRQGMPHGMKGGAIHFVTNAGPNSKVARHHVYVDLLMWNAVISSPAKPMDIAAQALKGRIAFDCDCERHTFWYRYIATIGNYNYGRPEEGFPKVRNPNLRGVACKHVLRVAQMLQSSPTIKAYVAKQIERARAQVIVKNKAVTVREQEELLAQLKKESHRQRAVLSAEEKRAKREAQPAVQRARLKAEADLQKMQAKKLKQLADKRAVNVAKALKDAERTYQNLVALGMMSAEDAAVALAKIKAGK